jgi:hypothetical protein
MRLCVVALLLILLAPIAQSADGTPPVYLSHFSVVLDKPTYHALQASPRVQSLADSEVTHTQEGGFAYSGFYVRGRHTYIEFFGDPVPEGEHLGHVGLGLAVECTGGVGVIAENLRTVFGGKVKTLSATHAVGADTVPWYTATYIDDTDDGSMLFGWVAEIDPGYLAALHPHAQIHQPLSREQYLSWDFKADRLIDDVVGLKFALAPSERAQLSQELKIVGWTIQPARGGFTATGPDIRIMVTPARAKGGLQQIDLRLLRAVPKQDTPLGSAQLILEGTSGRFTFAGVD